MVPAGASSSLPARMSNHLSRYPLMVSCCTINSSQSLAAAGLSIALTAFLKALVLSATASLSLAVNLFASMVMSSPLPYSPRRYPWMLVHSLSSISPCPSLTRLPMSAHAFFVFIRSKYSFSPGGSPPSSWLFSLAPAASAFPPSTARPAAATPPRSCLLPTESPLCPPSACIETHDRALPGAAEHAAPAPPGVRRERPDGGVVKAEAEATRARRALLRSIGSGVL
mmetsp:Transcript_29027/g.73098  ORF Transcript_29027/g.73098 Transcript_29027/m.73098 type:complete len:226 (-) Transcript_29027:9-686(-)